MSPPSIKTPEVSVIVPVYNAAPYISEAVDSVLAQGYPSCDVIVIDDGSTDGTRRVMAPYDGRVRYLYLEHMGVSAARNHGLRLARGKYVVFLDADDFFLPGKVHKQVAYLERRPSLGMVHSGWRLVNEGAEAMAEIEPWDTAPNLNLKTWLLWKPVFPGAMMFKRAWLERVGGFDTRLQQAEDVDLVLRLSLEGCKADWLREPTVCYRQHGSNAMRDRLKQAESLNAVMDKFFALPDVPGRIRRMERSVRYHTLMWCAWQLYRAGQGAEAEQYLRASLNYADLPSNYAVLSWFEQFARWAQVDDMEMEKLRALCDFLGAAARLEGSRWKGMKRVLAWWMDVWWFYLNEDYARASEELSAYKGLEKRDLIKLAQAGLLIPPAPTAVRSVKRFWQDAVKKGLVHHSSRHDVTALYLTLFAQAVFSRRWPIALNALSRAFAGGWHFKAWPAWYRFLRSALGYFVMGRTGEGLV